MTPESATPSPAPATPSPAPATPSPAPATPSPSTLSGSSPGSGAALVRGDESSPSPRVASSFYCPGSVSGHAQNDRSGRCAWCGYQVDPPVPAPRLGSGYRTELDLEYRRHYDPDWGSDPLDV